MSFQKLPDAEGEVVSKDGIECGEWDNINIIDKCVIQKIFRGTNYRYDQY